MSSSTSATSSQPRKSQATTCQECRRLKIKCDRVFPCAACIRRGCGNLCPNGTLEKGKRGFLKRLEQALPPSLNKAGSDGAGPLSEVAMFVSRDAAMAKRIKDLEAALVEAGVEVPGLPRTTHSNTNKRIRAGGNPSETEIWEINNDSSSSVSDYNDFAVGFGTLTIDPKNRSRYIGLSSGSAYLDSDMWGSRGKEDQSLNRSEFPGPSVVICSEVYPLAYEDYLERDLETQILATLCAFPPYEEAVQLANLYFQHISFMYEVVPKETFFSKHLSAVYNDSIKTLRTPLLQHTVALVGIVLAIGQYFDLEKPRSSVQIRAAELFRLASFALNSRNIIDGGLKILTLQGLQTLHLMAVFNLSMKDEEGAENAWQLLGLAVRSMQAQGFHIDPSRWSLPTKDLEERRRVFWEIHLYDCLQSFAVGRPCAQSGIHFDCKMPTTSDCPLPSDSDSSNSTWSHTRWHTYKFRWAEVLGGIMDNVFSVKKPPTYSAIMQYDQQINEFYFSLPQWILSPYVMYPVDRALWAQLYPEGANGQTRYDPYEEGGFKGLGKPEDQTQCSQMNSLATMIFTATLHLHRGPFCRALMLEPQKMLKSQYEQSIARVVSSSTAIVNIARGMFVSYPNLTSRLWYWVFHTFSAAVCQAVFVIVAPFHPLASHAFRSLQDAIELFKQADGKDARTATVRLSELVKKSAQSMTTFRNAVMSQEVKSGRAVKRLPISGTDVCFDVEQAESIASEVSDIVRFPESNARKPEDFLGASTKLVRLPEDFHRVRSNTTPVRFEHLTQQGLNAPPEQQQQPHHALFGDPFAEMMGLYKNASSPPVDLYRSTNTNDLSSARISSLNSISQMWAGPAYHATHTSMDDRTFPPPDFQDFQPTLVRGAEQHQVSDAIAPVIGHMHPGLHFNDVDGFNLLSFIQDGAKAWAYEPLAHS
ncbi:fungal-specific transcription factor domain-containing protein [Lentinula edodes]|nr:fungal-specific transcription factor domain-containing protein [Lentinula edodes]